MSIRAMTWAFSQRVGDSTRKNILLALADFADDKHECFPSQRLLSELAECSVDTVQRHVARLEKEGFISRLKRGRPRGGRTTDLYALNVSKEGTLSRKLRSKVKPQSCAGGLNRKALRGEEPPHTEPSLESSNERKRINLYGNCGRGESNKQRQQSRLARKDSSLTLKGNPEQAEEIPQAANQNPRGEIPNQATSLPPGPNPHRSLPHAHVGGRP